jgi:hypothetical protein
MDPSGRGLIKVRYIIRYAKGMRVSCEHQKFNSRLFMNILCLFYHFDGSSVWQKERTNLEKLSSLQQR